MAADRPARLANEAWLVKNGRLPIRFASAEFRAAYPLAK